MSLSAEKQITLAFMNFECGIGVTRGYWQYLTAPFTNPAARTRRGVEKAADFLCRENADFALFTEIDRGSRHSGGIDQLSMLSKRCGFEHHIFFPTCKILGLINQGNGICSKYPVLETRNIPLPASGQPRFVGLSRIRIDQTIISIMVTHLSLFKTPRLAQFKALAEEVNRIHDPVILAGDFNTVNPDKFAYLEQNSKLKRICHVKTFPSWKPEHALDAVLASEEFNAAGVYIPEHETCSDHLPIVLKLSCG